MKHSKLVAALIVSIGLLAANGTVYAQEPVDGEGFPWPEDAADVLTLEQVAAESSVASLMPVDLTLWSEESYPPVSGF